jgi:uncharacterized protein
MASQQSEKELRSIARESGSGDALYKLGLLYSTGQGVPLDHVAAHKWFNLAAMAGNPVAREWRKELAGEMTPDEIAEAQRQAREWLSAR